MKINIKRMKITLLGIAFLVFTSCSKTTENTTNASGVSNDLHLSFVTPDWNRTINCNQLNLFPTFINDSTNYVSATSASTLETFCFSLPADSSQMVKTTNLKKYNIRNFFENNSPFEFSQKLPLISGSNLRLISMDSISSLSFNEVTEINYIGFEANYCLFKVKCKYEMLAKELNNETNIKPITGSFHFKVRTSRR
jgi:hypothetical protein